MSSLITKTLEIRGVKYEVREMRGIEQFRVADLQEKEGMTGMAAFLLKTCVISPKDFKPVEHPANVCQRLVNEITSLSGLTAEAVEDAEKK